MSGNLPNTISGYGASSGYEAAARTMIRERYAMADGVRLRKGRVEIRRASSTGWSWFDIGSLEDVRAAIYPHRNWS